MPSTTRHEGGGPTPHAGWMPRITSFASVPRVPGCAGRLPGPRPRRRARLHPTGGAAPQPGSARSAGEDPLGAGEEDHIGIGRALPRPDDGPHRREPLLEPLVGHVLDGDLEPAL